MINKKYICRCICNFDNDDNISHSRIKMVYISAAKSNNL